MNIYEQITSAPKHSGLILSQEQVEKLQKWLVNDTARIAQLRAVADGLRTDCVRIISADLVASNMKLEKEIATLKGELLNMIGWDEIEADAYKFLRDRNIEFNAELEQVNAERDRYKRGFQEMSGMLTEAIDRLLKDD